MQDILAIYYTGGLVELDCQDFLSEFDCGAAVSQTCSSSLPCGFNPLSPSPDSRGGGCISAGIQASTTHSPSASILAAVPVREVLDTDFQCAHLARLSVCDQAHYAKVLDLK